MRLTDFRAQKNVKVFFDDEGEGADAEIDYMVINGALTKQAEDQDINTAVWVDGACGGGSRSQLMHCDGFIDFGSVSFGDAAVAVAPQTCTRPSAAATSGSRAGVVVADLSGRLVKAGNRAMGRLPQGVYVTRGGDGRAAVERLTFRAGE